MIIETVSPSSDTLEKFNLRLGENDLVYRYEYADNVTSSLKIKIFFYTPETRIVISDIDGTITKSDFLGYLFPLLGISYHFDGLVDLYKEVEKKGYDFVYLTARSIHEYQGTRKYIQSIVEDGTGLPSGPILMYPKSFFGILKNDLITKRSDVKIYFI